MTLVDERGGWVAVREKVTTTTGVVSRVSHGAAKTREQADLERRAGEIPKGVPRRGDDWLSPRRLRSIFSKGKDPHDPHTHSHSTRVRTLHSRQPARQLGSAQTRRQFRPRRARARVGRETGARRAVTSARGTQLGWKEWLHEGAGGAGEVPRNTSRAGDRDADRGRIADLFPRRALPTACSHLRTPKCARPGHPHGPSAR